MAWRSAIKLPQQVRSQVKLGNERSPADRRWLCRPSWVWLRMLSTPSPNRLAREKSPYLLQHATNPVDWFPWGEGAFAKAGAEKKPIFLSVGSSTCHWCHVMEHESFESAAIAAFLA